MGAGTVERTEAERTGAVDRTRLGAGGASVVGAETTGGTVAGRGGGIVTECVTASSFTMTGVPTGALSKNVSAISLGMRMQPCDAA